ncbi:hypothetical protein BJY01DRAFT_213440 [Aspergillus pseudoustus]|uniref:2EXR domain-containing protein n=1 Tax=Aspergillus pseudoustus TaxID=1810923 RepID=A0ABR4K2M3_9EURO
MAEQSINTTTFPSFSRLPPEIRLLICKAHLSLSANRPMTIQNHVIRKRHVPYTMPRLSRRRATKPPAPRYYGGRRNTNKTEWMGGGACSLHQNSSCAPSTPQLMCT